MRTIYRFIGTWLLGLTLVLLIVDGTKSLGASELVITSLREIWIMLHAASYEAFAKGLAGVWNGIIFGLLNSSILSWPSWLISGVPGLWLAFLGRSRATRIQTLSDL